MLVPLLVGMLPSLLLRDKCRGGRRMKHLQRFDFVVGTGVRARSMYSHFFGSRLILT